MNDPEKSDPRIVATKPTNKAGRPGAELVEPRLGTKGNAGQQSTHRSQSRARVTQALDRVRHAARHGQLLPMRMPNPNTMPPPRAT
jgi:RNA-directed DNA polymerase